MNLVKLSQEKGFLSIDKLVTVNKTYYYLWMCELQKWLREVHKIHIELFVTSFETWTVRNLVIINKASDITLKNGDFYASYEEALEKGLIEALKLIGK